LLFMGGILGRLFREFAVTISVAILISGLVSVTLTPMLASRFLRSHAETKHGRLYNLTERFFDGMLHVYDRTLLAALRHRPVTMVISFAVLVASVYLYTIVPKGFLPSDDTDTMMVITEAVQGASHLEMFEAQQQLAEILRQNPNVDGFMSSVGGASGYVNTGSNTGRLFAHLKPRSEREMHVDHLIAQLRPQMNKLPYMRTFL